MTMASKNVHIGLKRCLLPSCSNSFAPKGKGPKTKKFCSDKCRSEYFAQARKMGEAALKAQNEFKKFNLDTPNLT